MEEAARGIFELIASAWRTELLAVKGGTVSIGTPSTVANVTVTNTTTGTRVIVIERSGELGRSLATPTERLSRELSSAELLPLLDAIASVGSSGGEQLRRSFAAIRSRVGRRGRAAR